MRRSRERPTGRSNVPSIPWWTLHLWFTSYYCRTVKQITNLNLSSTRESYLMPLISSSVTRGSLPRDFSKLSRIETAQIMPTTTPAMVRIARRLFLSIRFTFVHSPAISKPKASYKKEQNCEKLDPELFLVTNSENLDGNSLKEPPCE